MDYLKIDTQKWSSVVNSFPIFNACVKPGILRIQSVVYATHNLDANKTSCKQVKAFRKASVPKTDYQY